MRTTYLSLLLSVLAFGWCHTPSYAQDLVFSGAVVGVSADTGTLILSNGSQGKMTLTGLQQARIRAMDGRAVGLANLRPGMRVSVSYVQSGRNWVVSRILVPGQAQPDVAPLVTDPKYRSLFDGDITTNPGSKAAIDNDITTKPAGIANRDGDITTRADK